MGVYLVPMHSTRVTALALPQAGSGDGAEDAAEQVPRDLEKIHTQVRPACGKPTANHVTVIWAMVL